MSKVNYRVQFDIPEIKLATVMGLIAGEVTNMVVRDTATLKPAVPAAVVERKPAVRGHVAKRGSITAAAVGFVTTKGIGQTFHNAELASCIKNAGGSEGSATPLVSYMARDGYLSRMSGGVYRIAGIPPIDWKCSPAETRT